MSLCSNFEPLCDCFASFFSRCSLFVFLFAAVLHLLVVTTCLLVVVTCLLVVVCGHSVPGRSLWVPGEVQRGLTQKDVG